MSELINAEPTVLRQDAGIGSIGHLRRWAVDGGRYWTRTSDLTDVNGDWAWTICGPKEAAARSASDGTGQGTR